MHRQPPNRREFLRMTSMGAASMGAAASFAAAAPETKKGLNVLFIMTDEQHWRSLSITGNPYIETPNMDRIAREGALFTKATCVTPYCSPSRASILTGLYPHRHGILSNVSPSQNKQPALPYDAFPNTESILHDRGYVTKHRGKWHLGDKGDFPCYETYGYSTKAGSGYNKFLEERLPEAQFADDKDPGRYAKRPVKKIEAIRKAWKEFNKPPKAGVAYIATIGRTVIPPEWLPETLITNDAIELIEQNADRNFMITVSWSPPHDLWVTPEPYYSMVDREKVKLPGTTKLSKWDEKGASKRLGDLAGPEGIREYAAIYHGMVKYIDNELGRILNRLDELGLTDNTLVIFTSDHGDMVGAHGCIGKSISTVYDDLLRIPLAIRLPGKIAPGTVVDKFVSHVDFMPTILDYVGVEIPEGLHGSSLRPLIDGKDVEWRDYAFCQRASKTRVLRTERWKYIVDLTSRAQSLFDLAEDPNEDRDLSADASHAATLKRMRARLVEVLKRDGDPEVGKLAAVK